MPLVDALSLRVPVICSDLPVLREVSQGCADYIDPYDLIAWEGPCSSMGRNNQSDDRKRSIGFVSSSRRNGPIHSMHLSTHSQITSSEVQARISAHGAAASRHLVLSTAD